MLLRCYTNFIKFSSYCFWFQAPNFLAILRVSLVSHCATLFPKHKLFSLQREINTKINIQDAFHWEVQGRYQTLPLCFSLPFLWKVLNAVLVQPKRKPHKTCRKTLAYPKLVIVSWGALFNESTVIRCNISMMRIFLQHIYLQFDFLLFILKKKIKHAVSEWQAWLDFLHTQAIRGSRPLQQGRQVLWPLPRTGGSPSARWSQAQQTRQQEHKVKMNRQQRACADQAPSLTTCPQAAHSTSLSLKLLTCKNGRKGGNNWPILFRPITRKGCFFSREHL